MPTKDGDELRHDSGYPRRTKCSNIALGNALVQTILTPEASFIFSIRGNVLIHNVVMISAHVKLKVYYQRPQII